MLRAIYRREFHILLDRAPRLETRQAYFDAFGSDDDVNGLWNAATKLIRGAVLGALPEMSVVL